MRNRSIKKQVWLNSRENELLKKKCMKAGLSESSFFRHVINDTQINNIMIIIYYINMNLMEYIMKIVMEEIVLMILK